MSGLLDGKVVLIKRWHSRSRRRVRAAAAVREGAQVVLPFRRVDPSSGFAAD